MISLPVSRFNLSSAPNVKSCGTSLRIKSEASHKSWLILSYAKVMENILFPWQFRSLDARPQESLRMLESFSLPLEKILKMPDVFRHAVSHRTFETIPNKFVRISSGSVSRKVIRKDAITGFKKPLTAPALWIVPESHKRTKPFLRCLRRYLRKTKTSG